MEINNRYNIGEHFSYWNFSHTKHCNMVITGILVRKDEILYECEDVNGSEDPIYYYEQELINKF